MSKTRIYRIWAAMKNRCNNKNDVGYKNYGGRGIRVCSAWQRFEPFHEWAFAHGYEEELTIERIDVNGNYCPENCTWVEPFFQSRNTRRNIVVEYKGDKKCLKGWCEVLSLPYDNIHDRVSKGWDVVAAFETPVIHAKQRDWSKIKQECVDRGVRFDMVKSRISSGWDKERALSEPPYYQKNAELREKCKAAGLNYATVMDRIKRMGWSEERALSDCAKNHTLREKCKQHNINYYVVVNRIYQGGWSEERALSTPTKGRGANQTSY
jgi:hypothetical protein